MKKHTSKEPAKSHQSSSPRVEGGAPAPRISGKYAKGDSRSKTMTANIKPSKGC